MQIHIVRPGESLWQIASVYGVNVQTIIDVNALANLPYLIPGQALIIPLGTSVRFRTVEVNAYINPVGGQVDINRVDEVGQYLTYISPFSYQVNSEGSLTEPMDALIIETAERYSITPLMVITNFREGNFDSELVHEILEDTAIQDTLIVNILETLQSKSYRGLNIDFERIPPEDRELYNNFLEKVVEALHLEGYTVSTALAPKTSDITTGEWHGAHDYEAHGRIVDFVILMTYEYGWSGGPPMAVSPITEVRNVLEYATTVIPSEKIMMGLPLYGYDWKLPYRVGGQWARAISPQEALQLAARYGATIEYDDIAQAPYFNYWDESGREHEVWFEDARSFRSKLFLVDEYDLKGVSYWALDFSAPQNWVVLDDMYYVDKIGENE